jgi:hypothetical protein
MRAPGLRGQGEGGHTMYKRAIALVVAAMCTEVGFGKGEK